MQAEVSDFLHYCRIERRLADLTCSAYERDVTACVRFLNESGIDDLRLVRPPDLRRFLAVEAERRPALGSQARTVAALKCFFRFCVENEALDRDPALVLRTPKKREALPDVLDRREMTRLLSMTERDERAPIRGRSRGRADIRGTASRHRRPGKAPLTDDQAQTFRRYARAAGVTGAQARHPAHAATRVRVRVAARRRKPAPNSGAARTKAPRLNPSWDSTGTTSTSNEG
jgi:hypothetical protein